MHTLILCAALAATPMAPQTDSFSYAVPPLGDALRRPPLRALPLSNDAPSEVTLQAPFAGTWQRFAFLRFGDASSTRVAIVVDHRSPHDIALYVDATRDLSIDATDLVAPTAPGRFEVSLAVATTDAEGRPLLEPRRVVFELGKTGSILGYATLGYLTGDVQLGERTVRALRRDGDGNGFFTDPDDQLWLDLDGDGTWAPLAELYLVQPILSLAGERYALRSDRLGARLDLERIEGVGGVRIALRGPSGAPREDVVEAQVLLVGRDGSAILARDASTPTEVPIGEYRIGMVTLRLADPGGGWPWSYVFSETVAPDQAVWRGIEKDAILALDPIGALDFHIAGFGDDGTVTPGKSTLAHLRLLTGDGLLVNMVYRGRDAPRFGFGAVSAKLEVLDEAGGLLTQATSGFA